MKTAIITGISGNLGHAVAKKFLAEGFYVIGTVVPNDPVKVDIKSSYFETQEVDLMQEDSSAGFIKNVLEKNKTIEVAVLTVGGFAMGDFSVTRTADIKNMIQLNFETAYNIARPVFLQMLDQQEGRIFLVGAKPGTNMKHSIGMVAYGLSKSLIFRLAELMNAEAKGLDVVTAVIVPSTIDTPQNRTSMPKADFSKWVTPEEIAEIIYFHASNQASSLREPVIKVYGKA